MLSIATGVLVPVYPTEFDGRIPTHFFTDQNQVRFLPLNKAAATRR